MSDVDRDSAATPAAAAVEALRAGLLGLRREQWQDAITQLDLAVGLDPDLAVAHAYRSSALIATGRPVEAQAAIDRALELEPDGFAANLKAGELSIRLGQLPLAEERLLAAVRAAVPASADERAASETLMLVRKKMRGSITHSAVLPRLPAWRWPVRAVRVRWRDVLRRPVSG